MQNFDNTHTLGYRSDTASDTHLPITLFFNQKDPSPKKGGTEKNNHNSKIKDDSDLVKCHLLYLLEKKSHILDLFSAQSHLSIPNSSDLIILHLHEFCLLSSSTSLIATWSFILAYSRNTKVKLYILKVFFFETFWPLKNS